MIYQVYDCLGDYPVKECKTKEEADFTCNYLGGASKCYFVFYVSTDTTGQLDLF